MSGLVNYHQRVEGDLTASNAQKDRPVKGFVNLGSQLTDSSHEERLIPLPRTPLPAGNHRLSAPGCGAMSLTNVSIVSGSTFATSRAQPFASNKPSRKAPCARSYLQIRLDLQTFQRRYTLSISRLRRASM